jgi:hypothetical protein
LIGEGQLREVFVHVIDDPTAWSGVREELVIVVRTNVGAGELVDFVSG